MTTRSLAISVLQEFYWLGSMGKRPSVRSLAERCCLPLSTVADAISWLDGQGLVDAAGLRLTLPGLAVAVASCARARSSAA